MTITPETRRNLYARAIEKDDAELARPVSYTPLTLPTKCRV